MPRLKAPVAICGWPADALVIDLTRQSCSSYCFSPAKHEMNADTPLSRQHSIKRFTLPPGLQASSWRPSNLLALSQRRRSLTFGVTPDASHSPRKSLAQAGACLGVCEPLDGQRGRKPGCQRAKLPGVPSTPRSFRRLMSRPGRELGEEYRRIVEL
jgi:hypothetical protein